MRRANAIRTDYLPIDDEGMCIPATVDTPSRFVFVTPSHQYPMGCVMSLARRQLLALARRGNSWIIEDDYDSEFRFWGRPIACLQGLEPDAPVLYLGTFSKTLYPGSGIGYLVLPQSLVKAFQIGHAELYRGGHLLTHAALHLVLNLPADISDVQVVEAARAHGVLTRPLSRYYQGDEAVRQGGTIAGVCLCARE